MRAHLTFRCHMRKRYRRGLFFSLDALDRVSNGPGGLPRTNTLFPNCCHLRPLWCFVQFAHATRGPPWPFLALVRKTPQAREARAPK